MKANVKVWLPIAILILCLIAVVGFSPRRDTEINAKWRFWQDVDVRGDLDLDGAVVGDGGGTLTGMLDTVSAKTADYALTLADCGTLFTNAGTSADITLTCGDTVAVAGYWFGVANSDSTPYTIYIDPDDADQIIGLTNAAGDRAMSTSQGDTIWLECMAAGSQWAVRANGQGTWADGN